MRVAIYARVSTPFSLKKEEEQRKQTQDINNQLEPLADYIRNRDWVLYYTYVDYASGKSTEKRVKFKQMMKDAYLFKFDVIICTKIDRFARSMQDFFYWLQELKRLKIRFIAISQNVDSDINSPTGNLLINIMASFAEFEREIIQQRVRESVETRRARGEPLGRPKVIASLDKMLELRSEGTSSRMIASILGIGRSTVERRLKEYDKANPKVKEEVSLEINEISC